jgi:tRNA threonylcarbamoyladenosine biosynthesis protein TsaE
MIRGSGLSETDGPAGTERAGAELAAGLRPGDVVLVSGDLGAGKTTFVRGALRSLGVTEAVTSPTFVVGILYDPGLLDPYFGPDTVTFVEWPERASAAELGGRAIARHVTLEHAGGDRRRIEVRGA